MNKRIKMAAGVVLITPLIIVNGVMAQQSTPTQTETKPLTEEQIKARLEAAKATLKQRLDQRKAELKLRLSNAEKTRLTQKCKPSQANVKKLGDKVNANVPHRYSAYEALDEHITKLIAKLEAQNIDATELKQEQTVLQGKIAAFKANLEIYTQALDDLKNMDCAADPEAFKASLEAARKLREGLSKDIADIRAYVVDTIKPTLVELRKQLESTNQTGGN